MIEPTDEMVQAAQAATCGQEADECMRDALAAVLAIVERDYRVEPRPPWERDEPKLCACPRSLCYSGEARALDLRCRMDEP